MSHAEILLLALALAMDALAVSLGVGAAGKANSTRQRFRIAFHFGLFQFLMPVVGWYAGERVAGPMSSVDHWIAFALLAYVGGKMVAAGIGTGSDEESAPADPTRGRTLVMLSVATSIDALAVGLSLALLDVDIWQPSVVIGVVAGTLSLAGVLLGRRLGEIVGRRAEVLGGVVLIGIGLRVLATHML